MLPSIFVNTKSNSDFLYSIETSLLVLVAHEFYIEESRLMFILTILGLMFFTFVTLVLQQQIFVGILLGGVMSHFIHIMLSDYINIIDDSCFSMVDYNENKTRMTMSYENKNEVS